MDYPIEIHGLNKVFYHSPHRRGGLFAKLLNYLAVKREKLVVFDSFNLKVRRGEIYCLLGPNGSGKTTLIRILSTTMLPDSGKALINGLDVAESKNKDNISASIGVILGERSRSFYWRLTARQNLDFYADLYELDERQKKERVDYLLESVGLGERKDDSLFSFSSGMLNRLAIARAFIHSPDILLLDEFMVNLDPKASADTKDVIKNLAKKEQKTVLLTSNNAQEAELLGDRIGILYKGKMAVEGSAEELKRRFGGHETTIRLSFGKLHDANLAESLKGVPEITSVDAGKNVVALKTTDASVGLERAMHLLKSKGADIRNIELLPPSLEAVFINVTKEGNNA